MAILIIIEIRLIRLDWDLMCSRLYLMYNKNAVLHSNIIFNLRKDYLKNNLHQMKQNEPLSSFGAKRNKHI